LSGPTKRDNGPDLESIQGKGFLLIMYPQKTFAGSRGSDCKKQCQRDFVDEHDGVAFEVKEKILEECKTAEL
jgi:hypothetical protein